ncbi:MAG TPA: MBL fold metallo-hydrolase [Thermoanaerobaculia bacterium]|nr:MBL fold metallo-hydrolase [Thermoanaerobaculia bacterium]
MITNPQSGTTIDEIADGIYRINTPVPPAVMEGGFSFNQYLIRDAEPVIFHTGPRALFPLVSEAISHVLPVSQLRYVSFSHFESDECGSLNDFLALAPNAEPLVSRVAAMVSVNDLAMRPARAMSDGERLTLSGGRTLRWIDAPHLPHNWETGYLFDEQTATLFCGDLFTQGGADTPPLTSGDILGPSEVFRRNGMSGMPDYWSESRNARAIFERLAATHPHTLACMHGSAWSGNGNGDGAALIMALADTVA